MKVENLDDPFLQEEHQADAKLTKIAESKLNKEAAYPCLAPAPARREPMRQGDIPLA